ncbi:MAG: aldo/keto reductase [Candidatus Dormibacteria bacterium]
MHSRRLGTQGLVVSELGLGCMGMSEFYGPPDEQEATATIRLALELGVTLFDTADMYGPFTNERLLAQALGREREQVILATKFGNERRSDGAFVGVNGRPDYVHRACLGSLERLNTDHIDLYYQHRVDPRVPIEETVGAMAELVEEGKVRYLGLSEAAPATIRRAHAVHPISALQTEYSLFSRDPEAEILPTLRELGIGFVAYSPLSRGLLTDQPPDADQLEPGDFRSTRYPRFQGENRDHNLGLGRRVGELARSVDATAAQLALSWVLHQGEDIVPIPGTKRRRYLEENVAAAELDPAPGVLTELGELLPPGVASGERYANMGSIDR